MCQVLLYRINICKCLSRSTWACELKCQILQSITWLHRSRSTWACELKSSPCRCVRLRCCHAPRERVSWNFEKKDEEYNLYVTLHVSVWVEIKKSNLMFRIYDVTLHVSVWVEILMIWLHFMKLLGHAPRERVSWNFVVFFLVTFTLVTLHVSVWVEIHKVCKRFRYAIVTLHVSVWVEICSNW